MMISSSEMRDLEKEHSSSDLMERAGKGAFDLLDERFNLELYDAVLFCGTGKNGGDGFVLAKYLADRCASVSVIVLGDIHGATELVKKQWGVLQGKERITFLKDWHGVNISEECIVVDALFGTGFHPPFPEEFVEMVEYINKSEGFIFSLDIPSGVHADDGKVDVTFIEPDLIATMHDVKPGLQEFLDVTEIVDIGLQKPPTP